MNPLPTELQQQLTRFIDKVAEIKAEHERLKSAIERLTALQKRLVEKRQNDGKK